MWLSVCRGWAGAMADGRALGRASQRSATPALEQIFFYRFVFAGGAPETVVGLPAPRVVLPRTRVHPRGSPGDHFTPPIGGDNPPRGIRLMFFYINIYFCRFFLWTPQEKMYFFGKGGAFNWRAASAGEPQSAEEPRSAGEDAFSWRGRIQLESCIYLQSRTLLD